MAIAADFYFEFLFSGTSGKFITAGTDNYGVIIVFGMNFFFHNP